MQELVSLQVLILMYLADQVRKKRKKYSVDEYVEAILCGNRTILSQAITLVESSLPEHYETGPDNY